MWNAPHSCCMADALCDLQPIVITASAAESLRFIIILHLPPTVADLKQSLPPCVFTVSEPLTKHDTSISNARRYTTTDSANKRWHVSHYRVPLLAALVTLFGHRSAPTRAEQALSLIRVPTLQSIHDSNDSTRVSSRNNNPREHYYSLFALCAARNSYSCNLGINRPSFYSPRCTTPLRTTIARLTHPASAARRSAALRVVGVHVAASLLVVVPHRGGGAPAANTV
jgi:hypothetical protein